MSDSARTGVAGAAATMLAALSLLPVFTENSWLLPVAVAVTIVVLVGIGTRAMRFPAVAVGLSQLAALGLFVGMTANAGSGFLTFLPRPEWFASLFGVLGEGLTAIETYATPAPTDRSLVILVVGGVGLVAVAVDMIAATLQSAPWTGLPLLALYAVPSGLLYDGVPWTLFVPVAVGYLGLLVVENQHHVAHWGRPLEVARAAVSGGAPPATAAAAPATAGDPTPRAVRTAALAQNGRRIGAVVISAAVLIPAVVPSLPGDFGWFGGFGNGGGGGGGGRTIRTDNPIVDLQRDLTRGDNLELFTYTTSDGAPDYIRLVTLDVFDGRTWKTSAREVPASQRVDNGMPRPPGVSSVLPRTTIAVDVSVTDNLESRWLPLPYPATAIDAPGDWRYDPSTLDVVAAGRTDTQGLAYTVTTDDYTLRAETLDTSPRAPSDVAQRFTDLPDLGDAARARLTGILNRVTAGARSDFDKAAAIQQWFRTTGGFTYDTSRQAGHSQDALLDFLDEKTGYCEQFAATMGIMARMLGIPARVAVGYLHGTQLEPGRFVVRSHDAHAWPELYFQGSGWIRFEPTPAFRTGTAPRWTTQPVISNDPLPEVTEGPESTSTSTALPDDLLDDDEGGTITGGSTGTGTSIPWRGIALGLLAAAVVVAPALIARVTRRSRWSRAGDDPAALAEVAWTEVREAALDARIAWDPAESPRATGRRLGTDLDDLGRSALDRVVRAVERARFSRTPVSEESLRDDTAEVRDGLLQKQTRRTRLRALALPAVSLGAFSRVSAAYDRAMERTAQWRMRMWQRLAAARRASPTPSPDR